MNPRFQTQWRPAEFEGEFFTLPSLTKPSKSLSLREIIDRDLVNVITPSSPAEPWYDETILVPDFKRMDLVDIDNWKSHMDAERKRIEILVKDEIKAKKAAQRDAIKAERKSESLKQIEVKTDESAE